MSAWVSSSYSGFLPLSKDMHLGDRRIGNPKLTLGVNVQVNRCLSLYCGPATNWQLIQRLYCALWTGLSFSITLQWIEIRTVGYNVPKRKKMAKLLTLPLWMPWISQEFSVQPIRWAICVGSHSSRSEISKVRSLYATVAHRDLILDISWDQLIWVPVRRLKENSYPNPNLPQLHGNHVEPLQLWWRTCKNHTVKTYLKSDLPQQLWKHACMKQAFQRGW